MRGVWCVRRLVVCLTCLLVLLPRIVSALELGPIETRSALYEPLDARIPVHGAQSGDLRGLNVVLGSPAQFELAGVPRLQHLNLLRFVVVEQSGDHGYIQVRTDEPIIESSLTFLVDVDWPRGRTVRGYRLHLAPAAGGGVQAVQGDGTAPRSKPDSDTDTSGAPSLARGAKYGPIRNSETLWSISARMRPDKSVSVQRMMLAILQANPGAFEIGNVNALNAGTILRIPTRDEIGPDDLQAAIAEVQRQHSAWTRYRSEGRATPTPSAVASETPSRDSATTPDGRLEVVSPESTTTPSPDEGTQVATLRKELVLAMEEVDAGRRDNDELKLRLAEADDHIRELNRLVELKNEEIAALRSELHEIAQTAPQPDAGPEEVVPESTAASSEAEAKPGAVLEMQEDTPVPTPAETTPSSDPMPAEAEAEAEAEAGPKPTTPVVEPKSLPFGLGSLPVNPVFLVGGAGLLLILLGVVALLRRRRASSGDDEIGMDDALETNESSPSGEDNLLLELEAVAAELAEEQDDSRSPPPRVAPAHASVALASSDSARSDRVNSAPEDIAEERIAELWQDDRAVESDLPEEIRADDESSELTFDIDALATDDPDWHAQGDRASDEMDIGDLADLADLASERESGSDQPIDEEAGGLDRLFSQHEAQSEHADTSAADSGDLTASISELSDDGPDGAVPAAGDHPESRSSEIDIAESPAGGPDFESAVPADLDVDDIAAVDDDAGDPNQASQAVLDEFSEDGDSEALSLDEFGEDEVQTKIDLAQVYMEMGDTESARGFLEAVLTEGDAGQQKAAREMLSRLG